MRFLFAALVFLCLVHDAAAQTSCGDKLFAAARVLNADLGDVITLGQSVPSEGGAALDLGEQVMKAQLLLDHAADLFWFRQWVDPIYRADADAFIVERIDLFSQRLPLYAEQTVSATGSSRNTAVVQLGATMRQHIRDGLQLLDSCKRSL